MARAPLLWTGCLHMSSAALAESVWRSWLFLHLHGRRIPGRDLRGEKSITGFECFRSAVGFSQKWGVGAPNYIDGVSDHNGLLGREFDAAESAGRVRLKGLAEHLADGLTPFHHSAVLREKGHVIVVLRHQPLPIAGIECGKMLAHELLKCRLTFFGRQGLCACRRCRGSRRPAYIHIF